MNHPVLTQASEALTDAETTALLRDRVGDGVLAEVTDHGEHTVEVAPDSWHAAVQVCRDEPLVAFDMFDSLFGVDAGEDGLVVVAVLYSTAKGRRIMLRAACPGGREAPRLDSITDLYPGADWMEREAFDMFGIEFDGHAGLLPRILSVENFEGWPLRKDFALASRVAKPWPGVNEPVAKDDEGNVIRREQAIGEAPGPSGLDEVIAKQARAANADAGASDVDAEASSGGDTASADAGKARAEVEMDQAVYDDLIAKGKSERIARSKAKAAYIKAQRKAARDKAEDTRTSQAEARATRAAEQAPGPDDQGGLPGIPEGSPVDPHDGGGTTDG